jgi:thymidylate synthase (FAD)
MEVDVLRAMDNPERLVCQAARGDYFDGYVGDTEYGKLVETVNYEVEDIERVREIRSDNFPRDDDYWHTEAATLSFVEKQLSRGHYGPWEHPQIAFTVKGVSRVTMAQITRHRHMSFDVQSQRYVDFSEKEDPFVVPPILLEPEERKEQYPHVFENTTDIVSRHGGVIELDDSIEKEFALDAFLDSCYDDIDYYERMVDHGMPKEDARFKLPLATKVNMTFSGNARTFLHLLDMRKKPNAQWEVRELSEQLLEYLFDWMPYTFNYYADHGPNKLSP